jgi:hypothetical protein
MKGCCPRSEWWWFKWVFLAQPAIGAAVYIWAYG